jgi:fluoroquinolone transport system permease protein
MGKLKHLVQGEFTRLAKYNLFSASFAVALIWIVLAAFLSLDELKQFLPLVFLMESSLMTALLVGAEMFYEKKEHTISSLLISPMTQQDYMASKIIAHTLNTLIIFMVISGSLYFLKDYLLNLHWLVLAVGLVCAFYVFVGLVLSYYSKDFTALLMNYILLTLFLVFPSLMILMGLAPSWLESLLFYSPIEVTLRLMTLSITGISDWLQVGIDVGYVVLATVLLYQTVVSPKFKDYATRDLGV